MLYSTFSIWIWRLAILFITIFVSRICGSEAEGGEARLLVTTKSAIFMIDFEPSEPEVIAENLDLATGMDYNLESGLIIWSDTSTEKIFSMNMTGADKKIIADKGVDFPFGLSVDWIYDNVYWTDSGTDTINVASLDGRFTKVLFNTDLDFPLAIVVNPLEGWMFWSDWGNPKKIERSGMDGTHRSTIISDGLSRPNGLSIDIDTRKIYWVDADNRDIKCADYDGSNVKTIIADPSNIVNPTGLDIFEDSVYWSDISRYRIYKADKATGENQQTVAFGFISLMGIRVLHSSKQPKGTNYCQESGVCSHLCLPAPLLSEDLTYDRGPNQKNFTCACPNGMVLMDNQESCTYGANYCQETVVCSLLCPPAPLLSEDSTYNPAPDQKNFMCTCPNGMVSMDYQENCTNEARLLMTTHSGIYTVDLNTSENQKIAKYGATAIDYDLLRGLVIWNGRLIPDKIYSMDMTGADKKIIAGADVGRVEDLSVDWIYGNVYWTDSLRHTISVASLDGRLRKVLFNSYLPEPRAIVVNPLEGWMFWSDNPYPAEIERSGMDGTHRSTIITEGITSIVGLCIDTDTRKIYWVDATYLKCADYDGSNVKTVIADQSVLVSPFGLDVFEDSVYWSDWYLGTIDKADKVTGENHRIVARDVSALKSIRVFHSSKQPKGTNYCKESDVCSHWCLPAPLLSEDLTYDSAPDQKNFTCACPRGMVLMDNQENCTEDLGLI